MNGAASNETRLRWLCRDLFALLTRAEHDALSVGPEDAFEGPLLAEWRKLEERAKKLGVR